MNLNFIVTILCIYYLMERLEIFLWYIFFEKKKKKNEQKKKKRWKHISRVKEVLEN